MQIQFKGTNYELASDMTDLATKKLETLKKYLGRKERPVLVYADIGKTTEAHASGDIWFTEINLDMEGHRYNTKATASSIRTALDTAVKDMGRELRVAKRKRESEQRRGGAQLKNFFRFGR